MQMDYPNSPTYGQTFHSGGFTWMWDGQKWVSGLGAPVTSVAGRTGDIVLTHSDIADWAAATPFLPLAGGVMTGALTLSGNAGSALQAVPLQQLNSVVNSVVSGYLPLSGGTLTGNFAVSSWAQINASGFVIGGSSASRTFLAYNGAFTGNYVQMFDDGNGHIECNTTLWLNGNTGQAVSINGCALQKAGDGWLYSSTSFRAVDIQSSNNFNCPGSLFLNGTQMYNNGGYVYTPNGYGANGDVYSNNSVRAGTYLNCGGCTWQNSGGWMYTPNSMQTNGDLQSNSGIVRLAGMYWQNNGGWMYCPWQTRTDGTLQAGSNVNAGNDVNCAGVFRYWGARGARLECYGGSWGWLNLCVADVVYFSPDSGGSGVYCLYTGFSDARLKDNIRDTQVDALAAICAIPVREFEWKEEAFTWMPSAEPKVPIGIVAQELPEVMAHAIGTATLAGDYHYINDPHLTPYLIRAIQQLEARLAVLEAR